MLCKFDNISVAMISPYLLMHSIEVVVHASAGATLMSFHMSLHTTRSHNSPMQPFISSLLKSALLYVTLSRSYVLFPLA